MDLIHLYDLIMKKIFFAILAVLPLTAFCQPSSLKELTLAWKTSFHKPIISSPLVDGEIAYAGCLDSNLYALDIKSGEIKWKFKTKGEIRSTVALNGEVLYFTSRDGNLYALSKADGKLEWAFKTGGDKKYDPYDYYESTPIVNDNTIYFGESDSTFYALNATDGKLKWSYKSSGIIHTTPAIGKGKIYFGSFDGYVYALSLTDGKLLWKFKSLGHDYFLKGEMQFSPTYANGMVYIGGRDYNLYALDAEKGFCHWNRAFPQGWVTSITLSPRTDSVLLIGTSDPEVLLCIDGIYGSDIWKCKTGTNIFNNVAFNKTTCFAGTANGKLLGVNRTDGVLKYSFSVDGYNANHLQYLKPDDTYRDDIGSLIKSGDDYITFCTKLGSVMAKPVVIGNKIIFSSMDGNIYCLNVPE